tara:strand:- start:8282 stop:8491 length:210 start_codon:yes stop_codon:yes gene_type:complete
MNESRSILLLFPSARGADEVQSILDFIRGVVGSAMVQLHLKEVCHKILSTPLRKSKKLFGLSSPLKGRL